MFKTGVESTLTILNATNPHLVFVQVPQHVKYDFIKIHFRDAGYYCVDLHQTQTRPNIMKSNIMNMIDNNDAVAVIGSVENYDDIIDLLYYDFCYIYLFPNSKKYIKDNAIDTINIKDYFIATKSQLKTHAAQHTLLVCLV